MGVPRLAAQILITGMTLLTTIGLRRQELSPKSNPIRSGPPVLDYNRRVLYCDQQGCALTVVGSPFEAYQRVVQYSQNAVRAEIQQQLGGLRNSIAAAGSSPVKSPIRISLPLTILIGNCYGADSMPETPTSSRFRGALSQIDAP